MKNFQNKYKRFLDSIDLNENEYNQIKNNIIQSNKLIPKFKFRYALILLITLSIGTLIELCTSKAISSNINIKKTSFENYEHLEINSDTTFDKEIPTNYFEIGKYYSYEEIENKLNIKLLKNNLFNNRNLLLQSCEKSNDHIAKMVFTLIDEKEEYPLKDIEFSIVLKTKYNINDIDLWIEGGGFQTEKYYIKSLNTEAGILKYNTTGGLGRIYVNFNYDDVVYTLYNDSINYYYMDYTQYAYSFNEFKNILENFTLDK